MRGILPFVGVALAAKHQLFVGNLFPPATLHFLEFDDVTHDFRKVASQPAEAPAAWLAFSHDKKNVYAVGINSTTVASYRITSPSSVELVRAIPGTDKCFNKTAAFVQASVVPPYNVIVASWPGPWGLDPNGCGMSLAADAQDGSLTKVLDTWAYSNASSSHGIDIREIGGSTVVYSTDLTANAVWAHKIDRSTGKAAPISRQPAEDGSHPRHIRVHPDGKYLYVVAEAANHVTEYSVDENTGVVIKQNSQWLLLPEEKRAENKDYWSAEVMLSKSRRYLWATVRARSNTTVGYINAFALDKNGAIAKTMFTIPTTTMGGGANAISPSEFSDEYAAMTDYGQGYVEMFKMEGAKQGEHGLEYATARPVGKVDLPDGGCCANAVWYS